MNFFAKNIRVLRERMGLKLSDFDPYGIKTGTLSNYELGKTEPKLETMEFFSKFFEVSVDDLLFTDLSVKGCVMQKMNEVNREEAIPLVSVEAVAGFGNASFAVGEADVKEYYVVPKFKGQGVDFMIEICGTSMAPTYNSGDIVACRIIRESRFIQWNKAHILATAEQGILCKRIRRGCDTRHLLAVSDNENYEPFEVPEDEVLGMALVVGAIKSE